MSYTVPFGDGTLSFDLPAGMRGTLVESRFPSPQRDPAALLRRALEQPLESPTLLELASQPHLRQVCIAFTDISRSCPDHLLVAFLLEQLRLAGLPRKAITLLCGVGLHRPITEAEMRARLGDGVVDNYRVINHDARHRAGLAHLGRTIHDIPLLINKEAVEADLLIATGVVEPHNFAGYSGGSKTVVIGCCGEETIAATHGVSMIDRPGVRLGCVENNPFQEVMRAGGRAAGLKFVLNVVLDGEGQILCALAGDPDAVHDRLVSFARGIYETPIDRQFDVAIAGVGGAKDANIYQATRAATYLYYAPTPVVRPGGMIIVPARCPEGAGSGVGEQRFHQVLRDAADIPALVAELREHGFPPGVQRTYMVARAMADVEFVVAGSLRPEAVRECKMTAVASLEEGLAYARRKLGSQLDVAIIPHALLTLPVLAQQMEKGCE
ncbi:MAG: nickel-dependent lactate racemase [Anaerolineae bacterium]